MIFDYRYACRLFIAFLSATAIFFIGLWLMPDWNKATPHLRSERISPPQIVFLPPQASLAGEYAAVWSPAIIALPGAFLEKQNEHMLAPTLFAATRVFSITNFAGAQLENLIENMKKNYPRQWSVLWDKYSGEKFRQRSFKIDAPLSAREYQEIAPGVDICVTDNSSELKLDFSGVDLKSLQLPDSPVLLVLRLTFNELGEVTHVFLETSGGQTKLDLELVRLARHIRLIEPQRAISHCRLSALISKQRITD